ncbi:uncharacterized protein [Clytia hemisphaerica]|uniref:PH domain-containing protein n=1 Tax=Clytia hemisphaerica TaxID=252671 RepID=A0A7M5TPU0_9CNID|eukprot:TCONS_00026608-protein
MSDYIVFEGPLTKSPPLKKQHLARWKYRYFVLYDTFPDTNKDGRRVLKLLYFKSKEESRNGSKPLGSINLLEVEVLAVSDKPVNGYPFVLNIHANDRTWYLCTRSFYDFIDWITVLKERTDAFLKERDRHTTHRRNQYEIQRKNSISTVESSTTCSWSHMSRDRLDTTDIHEILEDQNLFPGRPAQKDDKHSGYDTWPRRSMTVSRFGNIDNRYETDSLTSSHIYEKMDILCQNDARSFASESESVSLSSQRESEENQSHSIEKRPGSIRFRTIKSSMRAYRRHRSFEENQITRFLSDDHLVFNIFFHK